MAAPGLPDAPTRSRWRWAVPTLAVAVGLLFGTSAALARVSTFGETPSDLAGLIEERTLHVEQMAERAETLSSEIAEAERDTSTSIISADLSRRADELAPGIGALPVTGPAVQVTLDDAGYTAETLPDGYTVDDVVVHQQDVQGVVNALWVGGAEAMMVQDQRIGPSSAVRCVGNTLYLRGRVYSPPYVITAIGDPERLAEALVDDEIVANYRSWSDLLGLGYLVEQIDEAEMPGVGSVPQPVYSSVVGDTEEAAGP